MYQPDYELLFQNNHLGIATTNQRFEFLQINRAFERLLGYPGKELCNGMSLGQISPSEEMAEESKELIRKLYRREIESFEIEKTYVHRDGSLIEALTSVTAAYNESGEMIACTAIILDMTERRRTERQLREALTRIKRAQEELVRSEKLASLGALVAGIAHEVNTPLGSSLTITSSLEAKIRALREALEAGGLSLELISGKLANLEHGAGLAMRNLQQAASLISNFKRVAVDRASGARRSFSLKALVEEVRFTLGHKAGPRIGLQVEIPDELTLDGFPGDLGRVFSNLLENALTHGFATRESGDIQISAWERTQELNEAWVRITVRDNGEGIAKENVARIFDPFFTTRLGTGGSGLGLHLAYGIAHKVLGGHLRFEPNEGPGACFVLDIPRVAPLNEPEEEGEE